jgi:hypothetical protein
MRASERERAAENMVGRGRSECERERVVVGVVHDFVSRRHHH